MKVKLFHYSYCAFVADNKLFEFVVQFSPRKPKSQIVGTQSDLEGHQLDFHPLASVSVFYSG
jgi:hypothetical protein